MTRDELKEKLVEAFPEIEINSEGGRGRPEQVQEIANKLGEAIDDYVVSKLGKLKELLNAPGTFSVTIGASGDVVAVTPAQVESYDPNT
jgi:SpoVK/Ycf46/Vps4 family AAA+-type ATPase